MKSLLISSGEPAGIGPDICLSLVGMPVVVIADKIILLERAEQLNKFIKIKNYILGEDLSKMNIENDELYVLHVAANTKVTAGILDQKNSQYVLNILYLAIKYCLQNLFSGLVTAPVHKGIINQSGIMFTGHTEFLAQKCNVNSVVMMLVSERLRIALATTHLPLSDVPKHINADLLINIIRQLHISLQQDFNLKNPCIFVAGLNPHAGENGYLGQEEINIINPVIKKLQQENINVHGAYSADTLFSAKNIEQCDVFLTMYHDQGLPVIKYASFGNTVNVTLGLPMIRTSVDHGTALELAGTGKADSSSLIAAVNLALFMNYKRGFI